VERISKNKIKFLRSLRLKKNREQEQCFLIEGEKMVLEAIQVCPGNVREVYVLKDANIALNFNRSFEINSTESEQISGFKTPNKCLALVSYPTIEPRNDDFTLVLDQIQDPGNLGTIIRLADWYGLSKIICSTDTVDCFNPKVIQASMGSIFRIKILYTDLSTWLNSTELPIYGALLEGENVYQTVLPSKAILVVGNEGSGISKPVQELITTKITIPRLGAAESLNVSIATSILLSEFFRG
jgi:RNA methyltransferase, TrmH family